MTPAESNGDNVSGNGAGQEGKETVQNARRLDQKPGYERPYYLPTQISPEKGCWGCIITVLVLLATVLFWVFIYWYNEPSFHPEREATPSAPVRSRPFIRDEKVK